MRSIHASVAGYEAWLEERLAGDLVRADLGRKHEKMADSALGFLRATCFRWAELAPHLCDELATAPVVDAVGDAHIENFGLWRDREGRLVWGVNDFDDAARTPYAYDLVRLGTSALVAPDAGHGAAEIAGAVLHGYRKGLAHPRAFVLEEEHLWLRHLMVATDKHRQSFWKELREAPPAPPPRPLAAALDAAMRDAAAARATVAARLAGTGSLGRPRFVALAEVRGGPWAREARAVVPSCWAPWDGSGRGFIMADGPFRSPDPCLDVRDGVIVRRLAPNSRKLKLNQRRRKHLVPLLRAMAHELANLHGADPAQREAVRADFGSRKRGWLEAAIRRTADATMDDWRTYRR